MLKTSMFPGRLFLTGKMAEDIPVLNHMYIDNGKNAITISSVLISMTAVLYFSMVRETYCVVIVFLQLMIKGGLLFYAIGKVGIKECKDA